MTDQDGCGNIKGTNSLVDLIIAYSLLTPDSIAEHKSHPKVVF
jgi:hypothetical protein